MAHGDQFDEGMAPAGGNFFQSWKLLDGATTTDSGAWIDVRGYKALSVDVAYSTTVGTASPATIQLRGSNATTKPANTTNGAQLGADVTATSIVGITTPVRWLKAMVSSWSTSIVTANAHAVNN